MNNLRNISLAIVGATGLVGREVLKILKERNLQIERLRLLASEKSIDKSIIFKGEEYKVELLNKNAFNDIEFAIFSAGKAISRKYGLIAAKCGCVVIDNSNAFRMDNSVPLVIPEINIKDLREHNNIIANPNCSTIGLLLPIYPLYKRFGIEYIIVSTYQSMSGAGKTFLNKYYSEMQGHKEDDCPIYNNVIPQIDSFEKNGFTAEEMKMYLETRKILHDNEIKVNATCVRVPVYKGHGESCYVKFKEKASINNIYKILNRSNGVKVVDDIENFKYPTPNYVAGKNEVFIGRIRQSLIEKNAFNMWTVCDNIRKGAALNAVQILESLL